MYLGQGILHEQAALEEAYRECKALEPVLGPCRMTLPPQLLPTLTTTASPSLLPLYLLIAAVLYFGGKRAY